MAGSYREETAIGRPGPFHIDRRRFLAGTAGVALACMMETGSRGALAQEDASRRPFPFRSRTISGALAPTSRTQAEQDDDLRAAYDRWKANYLVPVERDMYRVAFGKAGTENYAITVSEGQGYGMVIVPHLAGHDPDTRAIFDGLWRFVRANPSRIDSRLMGWHIPGGESGSDSAFDGDADITYGLLLADAQWGSDGEIDYRAAAIEVLAGMMESTIGAESRYPLLGDWVDPDGEQYNQWTTRPSDFMLGHFRAFARATGDPAWDAVVTACQAVIAEIQRTHSPETGLLPDFVQPVSPEDHTPRPADPGFLEGENDGAYGYNAGRTPWRIGVDALLNRDEQSRQSGAAISRWMEQSTGGDPQSIRSGYQLNGTPSEGSDYFTIFFAAPLAVAAMTAPDQQEWLNGLYESIREQNEEYYEDSVALLCLLAITGSFWDPTAKRRKSGQFSSRVSGRRSVKVLPLPGWLSTAMVPWCCSTRNFAAANPMPAPSSRPSTFAPRRV